MLPSPRSKAEIAKSKLRCSRRAESRRNTATIKLSKSRIIQTLRNENNQLMEK